MDNRIFAGVATIKSRAESLRKAILSIINQVDEIFVYLNDYDTIPMFLRENKITCFLPKNHKGDLGSNGKFYKASDPKIKGYFFTIDDDIVYAPDYVQKMVQAVDRYNKKVVVSCHGRTVNGKISSYYGKDNSNIFGFTKKVGSDNFISIIGTGVMCHHTDTIRFNCSDYPQSNMDDIYTSILCQNKGVPRLVMAHEAGWLKETGLVPSILTISAKTRKNDKPETDLINGQDWTLQTVNKVELEMPDLEKVPNVIDIVIPYVKSNNNEIIYALRSIEQNVLFPHRVIIIGEKPVGVDIEKLVFIPFEKQIGFDFENNTDACRKMEFICNHPSISDDFVLTNDDIYFANPVMIEDMRTGLYSGEIDTSFVNNPRSGGRWRICLTNTFSELVKQGYPTKNYETHTPQFINKFKMKKVYEKFKPKESKRLHFSLYHNMFQPAHAIHVTWGKSIKAGFYGYENSVSFSAMQSSSALIKIFKNHTYINHSDEGLTVAMKEALATYFPNKSKYEL